MNLCSISLDLFFTKNKINQHIELSRNYDNKCKIENVVSIVYQPNGSDPVFIKSIKIRTKKTLSFK